MTELTALKIQPKPVNRAPLRLQRTIGGGAGPTDPKPEAWNQLARVSITNSSADRQRALENKQLLLFGWLNREAVTEIASGKRIKRQFLVRSIGPDDSSLGIRRSAELDLWDGERPLRARK